MAKYFSVQRVWVEIEAESYEDAREQHEELLQNVHDAVVISDQEPEKIESILIEK